MIDNSMGITIVCADPSGGVTACNQSNGHVLWSYFRQNQASLEVLIREMIQLALLVLLGLVEIEVSTQVAIFKQAILLPLHLFPELRKSNRCRRSCRKSNGKL